LHAYVEAYGGGADGLRVRYEVAPRPDAPPVLEADAVGQTAGSERVIFTHMLMVRQLPPGMYTLRALVSPASRPQGDSTVPPIAAPIKVMTRTFEVARPAVLMASAEGAGSAVATSEVFLPVPDELFARLFRPEEASEPATLDVFRKRLAASAMASFDKGVELLTSGDYVGAESSFKAAIDVEANSTAPLTYLAATFAASGHDLEAASAWQTALIQGDDLPQIYLWLGDALLRTRELAQARTILEEAMGKWPADVRFAKPLALTYATFGQGREAVRTLRRYLDRYPNDAEALPLGVEWIYHLHTAGAVAQTPADDLKMARTYAAAYEKIKGPQIALLKEWLRYIERGRR
jgi:tetratricopeptide (TPR) repeat protein